MYTGRRPGVFYSCRFHVVLLSSLAPLRGATMAHQPFGMKTSVCLCSIPQGTQAQVPRLWLCLRQLLFAYTGAVSSVLAFAEFADRLVFSFLGIKALRRPGGQARELR